MRQVVVALGRVVLLIGCNGATNEVDALRAETDAIIPTWIDGWLADDPDTVAN